MGLDALLKNQFGHGPRFQKLHIHSLSTRWCQNWAYFRSIGCTFWDSGSFSQLPYLGMKLGKYQSSRSCTCILFLARGGVGWNLGYFCSPSSGFWYTGQCSKLPHLGMKLGKCPKFQKLHIYPLSTTGGRNWAYFRSMDCGFQDMDRFSKLPYLGMKLGH